MKLPHRLRSTKALCALAVTLTAAAACGDPADLDAESLEVGTVSDEIKNGHVLANGSPLAGVVRVELWDYDEQRWRSCSGQVTSRNTLLTAAHCVDEAGMSGESGTWPVRITRQKTDRTFVALHGAYYVMAQVDSHPDFIKAGKYDHQYDIAVIKSPGNWLNTVKADAASIVKTQAGTLTAWAIGYGYYDGGSSAWDDQMRGAEFTNIASDAEYYIATSTSAQPQMCIGDSGGPLKQWYLGGHITFGVASHIDQTTGNCGKKAFWARTKDSWSWILSKTTGCTNKPSLLSCW